MSGSRFKNKSYVVFENVHDTSDRTEVKTVTEKIQEKVRRLRIEAIVSWIHYMS